VAELIHTIGFRVGEGTYQALRQLATENKRTLGDVVRILVEKSLYQIEKQERDSRG
jgi:hypothetical protein